MSPLPGLATHSWEPLVWCYNYPYCFAQPPLSIIAYNEHKSPDNAQSVDILRWINKIQNIDLGYSYYKYYKILIIITSLTY